MIINGRFRLRPVSGVERYAGEVVQRFPEGYRIHSPKTMARGLPGHLWEQFKLPLYLKNQAVLWSPANSGPLAVRRQVVSIHDVSPLENPAWFTPWFAFWYRLMLPRLARVVAFVIADSVFTRDRIVHLCGVEPDRIAVIPCGVDQRIFHPMDQEDVQEVRQRYHLPDRYFLNVGSLAPRKNLGGLLLAWSQSGLAKAGYSLAVTGTSGPALGSHQWDTLPIGVRLLGYVPDSDLPSLYSGACAFVLPSHYEGFGLPILEAMACGTPVIASNRTALPEVVGEAGILVDADDPGALAKTMTRVSQDGELRSDLIDRGRERAAQFTWERTSQRIYHILESVDG